MKWTETITPKQAVEELGVPYHGWMREMDRAWVSEDGQYSVMSRLLRTPVGKVEHVAITSAAGCGKCDGSGDIPWAVKMQIKNEFGMLRPVCVEEQKLVAAYWQGTSAPRRQWKIVHKYKVEYRSPVSNRELLKKSYVWAVSAEEAVGYAKENVGISGLIVNAEESNESDS